MKKFLSIMLSILMVVTMLPMAVMPVGATGAQSQVNDNFKVEITRLFYTDSSGIIYDYTDAFNSWALYDLALTNVSDGECQLQYTAALLGSDGVTGWDNDSVTLEGVSCDSAYTMSFEKFKTGSTGEWKYTIQISKTVGHAYSDWSYIDDEKHSRICAINTAHTINGEHSYNNGFCDYCDAYQSAELNENGYYEIGNAGQLFWYANYINTVDRTANAVLTADVDLENRPWTPIGSTGENSNNFRGIFDGQNYTIRGLYVEGDRAGLGFFGEVRTGTVKNFTIYGEVVVNTEVDYVGGVIGSVCGVNSTDHGLERNGAIIQNIKSFVNLTVKAHGVGKIGGFVGYANHQSLIEKCSWYGTFDAGEYRVDNGAGGFIGRIQENSSEVTIRNCGAYGTIKTNYAGDYNNTATIYMGGFLSFSNTSAKTTLENCLFAGKFERGENLTDEAFLGAFGTLRSVNAIKNCFYLGDDGLEAVHSDSLLKPGSDNVEITKVTEEQLKSGEVAYKLQEANEIWGQFIGGDAYPVLGGEEVYYGYISCDDEAMVYTNDSRASATTPEHSIDANSVVDNGDGTHSFTCTVCGDVTEPHTGGTATCKTQAVCEVCEVSYGELDPDNHEYENNNGFCTECDAYEPATDSDSNNYYEIDNAGKLYWFAAQVNSGNTNINGELKANIVINNDVLAEMIRFNPDPSRFRLWTPIGTEDNAYIGDFCGLEHTVSGLYFNDSNAGYVGLFGYVGSGMVNHVGVIDSYFNGSWAVGGVVGHNEGIVEYAYSNSYVGGTGCIGGVVGDNRGTVMYAYNLGSISGLSQVGGVTGTNYNTVKNCYNIVSISGDFLFGDVVGDNSGTLENCYYPADAETDELDGTTAKTWAQFKSGEVAYLLGRPFGQTIGTNSLPVLYGETVYYGYTACDDEAMVYTNDSRASSTNPDHSWDDSVLTRPTKTQDGYYTYTCSVCGETKTEPVERAANYDEYEKALEDLRSYLDSDMLTDKNKGYISEWLATYDTDEAYSCIAGEEETVQMYIDATAYYASEFEAAIEDCLAGNHSGNGDYCEICGATIRFATITGVSINVDGVIYTSDNTSAENPAVINPDSVVTITVTGENFDLLPAGPENAVIGFTYFSQNLEWLYNNPSKFDIDTVNNTVSFPANYNVLSQATTASELTYTNDDWYTDIGSGVYVIYIDKKDIADTLITLDNTEFIYSGNPIEPTVLVMADGQALMEGEHYTLTFESNVNAGTAIVTVKGIGDYTGEVTKDFTITKAYYNLTAPTPDTLTYNGEKQYLVSAGTVEGADFEYSLDGVSWSTSIPQAKDVGNYTVYYRVLADENHYGIEGTVDVTIKECPHEWNEGVLTRPVYDAVLGSKDGYYTYTCTVCGEEKTETVKSADYSAYEAVSEEINALLQSEELTPEAKQAIYSAANECGHLSDDLTESEQNIVDDLVAELEKIVADAEEKIASGEYVKADYTEIDEAIASVDEALENATINEEMANELSDIKSQLEALKENENTSMADAAELLERVKAVAETMADCANGIHSFTKYEETEAPECGKAGKEVASCDHGCGATDEKEIPALTHKDEDGDLKCDHGCGHEFEQPVEPEQPDTPDEPEQPEEDGTICEYCGSNHNNPITRIFCRIIQFFIRLFTFLGFWE